MADEVAAEGFQIGVCCVAARANVKAARGVLVMVVNEERGLTW